MPFPAGVAVRSVVLPVILDAAGAPINTGVLTLAPSVPLKWSATNQLVLGDPISVSIINGTATIPLPIVQEGFVMSNNQQVDVWTYRASVSLPVGVANFIDYDFVLPAGETAYQLDFSTPVPIPNTVVTLLEYIPLGETGPQGPPGLVQSIVGGANVVVDSTDPSNPVVSYHGSEGSVLVEDVTDPGFYVLGDGPEEAPNRAPSVTLGVSQNALEVTASFIGFDPDFDILDYIVDWGDGTSTAPATSPAVHEYAAGGIYTIEVAVSDGALIGTDDATVTVVPAPGPGFGSTVLADEPVSAFLFQEIVEPVLDSLGVMAADEVAGSIFVGTSQAIGTVIRTAYFSNSGGALEIDLTPNSGVMDGWTEFSIELLIRPDLINTTRYIIAKDDGSSNRSYRLGHSSTGKLQFGFHGAGSPTSSYQAATSMVDNADYHVVVTYDGTTARLYLNGVEDGSTLRSGAVPTLATPHTLGYRLGSEHFRGWMGGLAFYDKVLTPTQIEEHCSAAGLLA